MYARIYDEKVVEVFSTITSQEQRIRMIEVEVDGRKVPTEELYTVDVPMFHESIVLIPAPDDVQPGWLYDDVNGFRPPPSTDFDIWQDGEWVTDTTALNNTNIKEQIIVLEGTITARRIREAVLGTDNGWLSAVEDEIEDLRAQLT